MDQVFFDQGAAIVPDHLISSGQSVQAWSAKWLAAREYVRQNNKTKALLLYEELLASRPELIEARWECAQLLLALKRYDDAEGHMEILLETRPENLSYQQAQGVLLLATGRMERAVLYLAQAWAGDKDNYEVGMHLYQSYMALGATKEALPVLEILHRKKPDDLDLQQALFRLYVDLGNDQQAQALGVSLASGQDASFEITLQVAEVHARLGLSHLAAEYWQKIIALQPDYSPAHEQLATYYSEQGREAEALPHYLHGYSKDPDNSLLAGRIGAIYAAQNKNEQAITFLEQYLGAYPDDASLNLVLAQSYQAKGYLHKSSLLFSRYLELVRDPADEIRLQAAQVFMETGDKKKAVDQYQQLVSQGDESEKNLVNLAKNLAATGRYEEALKRWQQLVGRLPEDIDSRLQIVSLLDTLGRLDEMVAMLEEIHALDDSNYLVTLKLAEHYFLHGQNDEAWQLFTPLVEMEFFSSDFLAIRARIFHYLGLPEHAYRDMAEVVTKESVEGQHRLTLIDIAGTLGRHDVVMAQAALLADKAVFSRAAGQLVYARALGRVGELARAEEIYKTLLVEAGVENSVQARLDAAEMYRLYGFFYEAEQQYRLAWLDGHDPRALFKLVDLNLFLGQVRDAEAWHDAIPVKAEKYRCQRALSELRVLNGLEEFEDALLLGEHLLTDSPEDVCSPKQKREIKVQMAKAHFGEGDDDLSIPLLLSIDEKDRSFAANIYLLQVYGEMGDEEQAKEAMAQALEKAGYDAGLLATLMAAALEGRHYQLASVAGRQLRDTVQHSFGYLLRFIRVLELNGEYDEAYSLAINLLASHGDNALLNLFAAKLALSAGHYDKGLAMADKALSLNPNWYAALLVKARLHWALFQWPEAIGVYNQVASPPVEELFLAQCADQEIVLPPHEELSLWMKVVQPMGRPGPLQRSLGVDFVMSGSYGSVARQAAQFYARYKWQKLLHRELAARNSVKRREYYHAVKQYKSLLRDQNDTTLLFDLAGVYSSLDRVGDEAMVYQRLQEYNPDYPGLSEAISRNHLKRRPQTGATFSHFQKKGRKGYYDISQDSYGLSGWLSPKPQKEIKMSASRIHYQSPSSHDDFYGTSGDIYLATNFFDYVQLQATVGGHALSGDRASVGVYDFSVTGLAGDRFESYVSIKRQVVADTLASVERGLMAHIYEARAELDLMPRLQAGGELSRTEFSDDNEINGYSFWLSSILLPEPHFLKATFLYEFLDSQEKNEAQGVLLADSYTAEDHPYWSPEHYWRNHFVVDYKQKFSEDVLGRSTPSFFTAAYGFSYDVDEDTVQFFRAGFNIEISNAWILKVVTEFEESDKYRTRNLLGTLLYRW